MRAPAMALCSILLALPAFAFTIGPPTKSPACPTGEQGRLLEEGTTFYDGGSYGEAIRLYDQVIQANPDCPAALYERAIAYLKIPYLPGAMEDAQRASEYDWAGLPGVYDVMAQILETQGDRKGAMAVYKTAMAVYPDCQTVLFNAAVTYEGAGEFSKAISCAQKAVLLDPRHAGSHFILGKLWTRVYCPIEAAMALARFLQLEPRGERAEQALELLKADLTGAYRAEEHDGKVIARRGPPPPGGKAEMLETVSDFETLCALVAAHRSDKPSFAARFYAPYYAKLKKDGQAEAFCYVVFQSSGRAGIKEWQAANGDKILALAQWTREYKWPK